MGEARGLKIVLVVDDTKDIRELMRLQPTTLGYPTIEASNGRQAGRVP